MKNLKLKIGIILLVIIFVIFGVKLYNKPHVNVAKKNSDYVLTTNELIASFEENETIADKKYANKIIEINGMVVDFSTSDNKKTITLKGENAQVICQLNDAKNTKFSTLKKGEFITIKGQCSGFLMDVMLVNCFIKNN